MREMASFVYDLVYIIADLGITVLGIAMVLLLALVWCGKCEIVL